MKSLAGNHFAWSLLCTAARDGYGGDALADPMYCSRGRLSGVFVAGINIPELDSVVCA